jgi:D-lactate dehydrogenase (cytochrome)
MLNQLEAICRVSTNPSILSRHGDDESHHPALPPSAVAYARSTADVQAVVRLCNEARVPLIPYGSGTSLEGHIQATRGGVCLDMSEMAEVLRVSQADMDCSVQAGVTRVALNKHLRQTGLRFTVDPGADASIGGMVATGASGTSAVKHGTMRENVLGLTAVLASGEVMRTGGRARKSSAGYDLTRLLVGSEGTLAVVTEVTLRLHAVPPAAAAASCLFPTLEAAASAVTLMLQSSIPVTRCEVLDAGTVAAFNAYAVEVPDLPIGPHLLLEFEGASEASVAEQAEMARACCDEYGGAAFEWASSEADQRRLWQARHGTYYAALAMRPGSKGLVTDAAVPISRLAQVMQETADDIRMSGVSGPIFGHAGDGNFHTILLLHPDDPPEYVAAVHGVHTRIIERAIAVGGTCTGEHGVGVGKKGWLRRQHGDGCIGAMRAIKLALDPRNILNPDKVVDLPSDDDSAAGNMG